MLVSFFSMGLSSVSANTTMNHHLGTSVEEADITIQPDIVTNLLLDQTGNDLSQIAKDHVLYNLKSVDITRYRQKIVVEYYTGDYNASSFIGSDSGYADYEDGIASYIMSIPEINAAFNQNIPTTNKLVNLDPAKAGSFGYVGSYLENGDTLTVKVLATAIKTYPISVTFYQNKQDVLNPNPLGMTFTELDAATSDYWRVYQLSTSVSGVVGQTFDIRTIGRIADTYTAGSRTGNLAYFGRYDANNAFGEETTFTIGNEAPQRLELGGFYYKDDIGSPVKSPGFASAMSSGASIGFTGKDVTWKNSEVTESLTLDDEAAKTKLAAYPFNLDGDPFDTPEYVLYWLDDNWMLGHRLALDYYYDEGTPIIQYYTVSFESNGGNAIDPIANVEEKTSITAPEKPLRSGFVFDGWYQDAALTTPWNFETDVVTSDLTLYAKWSEEAAVVPETTPEKEDPINDATPEAETATSKTEAEKKTLPLTAEMQTPSLLLVGCLLITSFLVIHYKKRNKVS
ncbi:InlB B-repeat-containing protein [Isobaculum melis]|uniref:LPXTG-motif cell wall anchor domain-containing protein/Listeria/Bacterioides repeat-containing protein n=1 Tax=Isobaculum melis TaxID=142588 RepID=A0A1H9UBL6_9LACT|nr:InlB B-repeat-containing protein [Isobaculum melis]SES06722.1 LPXTG-motif cell wall anchor domain-containing protein/Listeria/Bacterioides repeat-containing protein [Isobaculum melis]